MYSGASAFFRIQAAFASIKSKNARRTTVGFGALLTFELDELDGARRLKKYGAQTFVYAPWHTLQSVRSQPLTASSANSAPSSVQQRLTTALSFYFVSAAMSTTATVSSSSTNSPASMESTAIKSTAAGTSDPSRSARHAGPGLKAASH